INSRVGGCQKVAGPVEVHTLKWSIATERDQPERLLNLRGPLLQGHAPRIRKKSAEALPLRPRLSTEPFPRFIRELIVVLISMKVLPAVFLSKSLSRLRVSGYAARGSAGR